MTAALLLLLTGSLYEQAIVRILEERFAGEELSYVLVNARTGAAVAARWDDPEAEVPAGSLLKPFTALAYGELHGFRYPEHECLGTAAGCWRRHGRVGVVEAIAHSCNAYFRELAGEVRADAVAAVARRFGITVPPAGASPDALAGLGADWNVAPLGLVRAYCEFARSAGRPLLEGLLASARTGTGRAAGDALEGAAALVKTGTAPCIHSGAPGDGYAVVLVPADSPRFALIVRVHGRPGSFAAGAAGRMLDAVLRGR